MEAEDVRGIQILSGSSVLHNGALIGKKVVLYGSGASREVVRIQFVASANQLILTMRTGSRYVLNASNFAIEMAHDSKYLGSFEPPKPEKRKYTKRQVRAIQDQEVAIEVPN